MKSDISMAYFGSKFQAFLLLLGLLALTLPSQATNHTSEEGEGYDFIEYIVTVRRRTDVSYEPKDQNSNIKESLKGL